MQSEGKTERRQGHSLIVAVRYFSCPEHDFIKKSDAAPSSNRDASRAKVDGQLSISSVEPAKGMVTIVLVVAMTSRFPGKVQFTVARRKRHVNGVYLLVAFQSIHLPQKSLEPLKRFPRL